MDKELPMLANKALNIGISGTPGSKFKNMKAVSGARSLTAEQMKVTRSHIRIELPFALTGMTGTYHIAESTRLQIQILQRPVSVAAHNIGLPDTNELVKNLKLDPDNWGYVNYTEVIMTLPRFAPTIPCSGKTDEQFCGESLRAVTGMINPLLDWYSLATGNYSIGRVSPRDFARFEVWHTLGDDESRWLNHTSYYFPDCYLSFESVEKEGNMDFMRTALAYGKFDDAYNLAYRLYAEANRTLVRGDDRLAAIQAISGLETAVFHYTQARALTKKDDDELQRISKKAYDEVEGDLTLSIALRTLLPLLIPDNVTFPKADFDACNALRKKRNSAVHEPQNFNKKDVAEYIPAVRRAIDFLRANHPKDLES